MTIWKNGGEDLWSIGYQTLEHRIVLQEYDRNEANARARMLGYLIENNLLRLAAIQ